MTLKEFMEGYQGFDWGNGTVVLVDGDGSPTIYGGRWGLSTGSHADEQVRDWTHTGNLMAVTLKGEETLPWAPKRGGNAADGRSQARENAECR